MVLTKRIFQYAAIVFGALLGSGVQQASLQQNILGCAERPVSLIIELIGV